MVVPLSATSDVDAVSGEVCETHKLDAAQCGQLREGACPAQQKPVNGDCRRTTVVQEA